MLENLVKKESGSPDSDNDRLSPKGGKET